MSLTLTYTKFDEPKVLKSPCLLYFRGEGTSEAYSEKIKMNGPIKKLEFRPFSLYASRDVIQKKLNEGYDEVAFSHEGNWVKKESERISRMCAFYHPNGDVQTYEHREILDGDVIRVLTPFNYELRDEAELKARLKRFNIGLGKKRSITDVLKSIIEWEFR